MRVAVGLGGIALMLVAFGCRDVLGIHDRPTLLEDAGVGAELGADAAAEADPDAATLPTFCEALNPAPQHCADFEKGDLRAGWDGYGQMPDPSVHGGGTFGELRDASGRKLVVTTPALVAPADRAGANLFFLLPVRPVRLHVSAELNVVTEEHLAGAEPTPLVQFVFGDEGAVVVYRDAQGAAVAVVPDGKAARFPSWPVGTVHTIGLSVDNAPVRGADGFAEAAIDGGFSPELILPAHFQKAGPPRVVVGLTTAAPVGAMRLVVDNVAIYWGDDSLTRARQE